MELLISAAVVLGLAAWLLSVILGKWSRNRWEINEYNWDPPRRLRTKEKQEDPEDKPENTL
jgi:hypothetical protein